MRCPTKPKDYETKGPLVLWGMTKFSEVCNTVLPIKLYVSWLGQYLSQLLSHLLSAHFVGPNSLAHYQLPLLCTFNVVHSMCQ